MNRNPRALLFGWVILALIIIASPSLVFAQALRTDGEALVVRAGSTESGDVATISQPIVIDGVVEGDVTSVTGSIIVRGSVEGDVVSLFGNVTFEADSVAQGNVMAATGEVQLQQGADVAQAGAIFNGNVSDSGATALLPVEGNQTLTTATRVILAVVLAILATIIATLLSLIWPRSVASGAQIIRLASQRALGLGLMWSVLSVAVVGIVALLLIFSLIGLAVLPVLLLIAQVPYLIGLAAIAMVIGQRLNLQGPAAVLVGSLVVVLPSVGLAAISLPAAFIWFYLSAGVGIGGMFLLRATVVQRHSLQF
ncbi:MAG TPA: hypothetical protein DEF47_02240 [Herpetosiphon sp.]|uniref:Polymer-forming cytoskeletal protein n=1 Tax=Herpetosiphon aurantiacus (strain ATCC 23779 / DSM 785 / 114-95) TaxID=316274 RepID=A9B3T5_HERA2|nr:hypothetical protein [Herpetosiphon sp.]ABX06071.1 hypothetical protein Haur_3435 [Herpetosiphon aurantiacus DSM 785]HBW48707.1 hypothetical protein [Herpetosiphon sp.]